LHAYVINLDRSPDRRAHIAAELATTGIDYEWIRGVDGRELDLTDSEIIEPAALTGTWFRPGVLGCALSHLNAYRKILAADLDAALMLEDDIRLPADLEELAVSVAQHLSGAEVALFNYDSNDNHPCLMSSQDAVGLPSSRGLALPVDIGQPVSSGAYLITREACQRMVKGMLPARSRPDDWRFFYREGFLDRVRCVVPMPVQKDARFGSTIDYSSQTSLKMRLRELAVRYRLRPVLDAIAYRRQRIFRRATQVEYVNGPFVERPSRLE
jgi:glycosyl transferase family 25